MRTPAVGLRVVACLCMLAMLLAPVLPPTGGTPAVLVEAAPLLGEVAPCTPVRVRSLPAPPDPVVAAPVPCRAPPIA